MTTEHNDISMEHMEELRSRLLKSIIAVTITTALSFALREHLAHFDCAGRHHSLFFWRPTEMFLTYFRSPCWPACCWPCPSCLPASAVYLAGLQVVNGRYVGTIVPGATLSFVAGVLFTYFVLLPFSLRYLVSFAGTSRSQWAIGEYITFCDHASVLVRRCF